MSWMSHIRWRWLVRAADRLDARAARLRARAVALRFRAEEFFQGHAAGGGAGHGAEDPGADRRDAREGDGR